MDPARLTLVAASDAEMTVVGRLLQQMAADHGVTFDLDHETRLARTLVGAGHRATLFMDGDRPAGFCMWIDLGDHVFIRQFMIDPAHRGQGLGRAIFTRLRAEVFPPKAKFRLEVQTPAAERFWSALGFVVKSTGMQLDLPEAAP